MKLGKTSMFLDFKLRDWLILVGVMAACLVLYANNLGFPEKPYYDEVYQVERARSAAALKPFFSVHPRLGNMLMGLGIRYFGDTSSVWRLFPLAAGLLVIPTIFLVSWKLTRNVFTSVLASCFFLIDGIAITQARIAMLNSMALLFMLLALYCFLQHTHDTHWPRKQSFIWSGLFLGLALSSKWTTAAMVFFLWGNLVWFMRKNRNEAAAIAVDGFLFLVLLPIAIYITNQVLISWLLAQNFKEVWDLHLNAVRYHATLKATHTYGSAWWSWPIMMRPIWYFFERMEGKVYGILCIGNPAVFWAFPLAFLYLLWRWWKENPLKTRPAQNRGSSFRATPLALR